MNLKPYLPGFRDLHLYGGAAVACAGLAYIDWRAALIVAGAYLVYLGKPWLGKPWR